MSFRRIPIALFLFGCWCLPVTGQEADIVECSTADAAISDGETTSDSIDVVDTLEIGEARVSVDLTHTFIGDLTITVASPESTSVTLHSGQGDAADDMLVTFSAVGVANDSDVFTCDCLMQGSGPGSLEDFLGETADGAWDIDIFDAFLGDEGTLEEWCVLLFDEVAPLGVTDLVLSEGDEEGEIVTTWTNTVDYDSIDIVVNGEVEATLDGPFTGGDEEEYTTDALALRQIPAIVCVIPSTEFFGDGPERCQRIILQQPGEVLTCEQPDLSVPGDGTEELFEIEISELLTIESVEVLVDQTTAWTDWETTLESPAGSAVVLNNLGGGGFVDMYVLFSDDGIPYASQPLGLGLRMRPSGPGVLADFAGELSDGNWELTMSSSFGEDGTLNEWCLNIDGCPILPPVDLECVVDFSDAELSWVNEDTYDDIEILVDGVVFDTIDGDSESYTAESLDPGYRVFTVRGIDTPSECGAPSRPCRAAVDITEVCLEADLDITGDQNTVRSELEVDEDLTIDQVDLVLLLNSAIINTGTWDILLTSPFGTTIQVHDQTGVERRFDVVFSDDGLSPPLPAGSFSSGTGIVLPSGPGSFADFAGQQASGSWVLDLHGGVDATLEEWCLGFASACDVEAPTIDSCTADGNFVNLEWSNPETYDSISVLRNEQLIATLDGDSDTYEERLLSGNYRYQIIGHDETERCGSTSIGCEIDKGFTETCDDRGGEVVGDGTLYTFPLEVEDEVKIFETEIAIDHVATFAPAFGVVSPDGTTIALGFTNATGAPDFIASKHGLPLDFAIGFGVDCEGCKLVPPMMGVLDDFLDEDGVGEWALTVTAFEDGTLDSWCVRIYEGCDIDPPEDLSCSEESGGDVLITWKEGDFDAFDVLLNGELIDTLEGSTAEYTDVAPGAGRHQYRVVGYDDGAGCGAFDECTALVGRNEYCDSPDLIADADFVPVTTTLEVVAKNPLEIEEVEVQVDITTDFTDSTLVVTLPEDTVVQVHAGAGAFENFDCIFSDLGMPNTGASTLECEGCLVAPSGPGTLADFGGEIADGDWTLELASFSGATLNEWCVDIFATAKSSEGNTFLRGDMNGDGSVGTLVDAFYILDYGFNSGPQPACFDAADADGNNSVLALVDALYLFVWGFQDGPEPPDPGVEDCGVDPEGDDDDVSCEEDICL